MATEEFFRGELKAEPTLNFYFEAIDGEKRLTCLLVFSGPSRVTELAPTRLLASAPELG